MNNMPSVARTVVSVRCPSIVLPALLLAALCVGEACAGVLITIRENGPNLDITAKGTLDLTGWTLDATDSYGVNTIQIAPDPEQNIVVSASTSHARYSLLNGLSSFGTPPIEKRFPDLRADPGANLGFSQQPLGNLDYVRVPAGFPSGGSIDFATGVDGAGLADLLLVPYQSWGVTLAGSGDTITFLAIPEPPATALLAALAMLSLAVIRYRSR